MEIVVSIVPSYLGVFTWKEAAQAGSSRLPPEAIARLPSTPGIDLGTVQFRHLESKNTPPIQAISGIMNHES